VKLRFAEAASEAYRVPLTIRHLLDGVVAKAGDQRIIYRDRASFSYRDFVGRIGRLASLLEARGAEPGMTIAMMDWDSHRYLESYFAVPMMGAVLQTVNVRMPESQIAYTLEHARAEIIMVHRDFFPVLERILPSLPTVRAVIAIVDGAGDDLPPWAAGEYEALSAAASPDYPFVDFDEDAVATTFYTTGTTGDPKGVCFSHRQLVLHTLVAGAPFGASLASPGLGVGDTYMPLTPMFHVHAWGLPYVATMLGLKQIYPGRYEPALICQLFKEHRVTYSHCVPTVLKMIIQAAAQSRTDLGGWKMTIGGAGLSRALCAEARELGMHVGSAYGMSETCPFIVKAGARVPAEWAGEEALSAMTAGGISLPLVAAEIVDEDMTPLAHDGVTRGELVVRAPWLTPCYTGDATASLHLWRGGWLHTQDVATIDARGEIRIRDRLKDMIKTGGEWIDSLQLEELVARADEVLEVSVVAVPDAKWGERPLAVVVPCKGAVPTLDNINAVVLTAIEAGAITRYARLDRFEIVDQLPRTSVGKIDKKALRARFATEAPVDAATDELHKENLIEKDGTLHG
jgi:fatty-acyl-CoA synthase